MNEASILQEFILRWRIIYSPQRSSILFFRRLIEARLPVSMVSPIQIRTIWI